MKLEKILLHNFLTYVNFEYCFEDRPIMVQGRNSTDDKQKSNGSGKSGLQTGIEFCITASNSRGVNDSEIVRFGEDVANATLIANCDVRRERICIDWEIKKKGNNSLTLTVQRNGSEDWEEISFSNVNDGKKWILNWFAISKEDLFSYFIINKTRFKSFFKSSNKAKVDLINRFSDASIINGIEKVDNSKLQSEFDAHEKEIAKLNGKLELTQDNLEKELERDLDDELREEVNEINGKILEYKEDIATNIVDIKKLRDKISDYRQDIIQSNEDIEEVTEDGKEILKNIEIKKEALKTVRGELSAAQKLVNEFVKTNWDTERSEWKAKIERKDAEKGSVSETITERDEQLTKIATALNDIHIKLSGAITCPSCAHTFILDGDIEEMKVRQGKLKDLNTTIVESKEAAETTLKGILKSIDEFNESIKQIDAKENAEAKEILALKSASLNVETKVNKVVREIADLEKEYKQDVTDEIAEIKFEISQTNTSIAKAEKSIAEIEAENGTYDSEINALTTQRDTLKHGDNTGVIKGYEFEISLYKKDIDSHIEQRDAIGDEIYTRNQWAAHFKQFKMHVANQSLEVMQHHTNRFLSEIGDDLVVKLDGFKVLANGSIKEEITAKIIRQTERSFYSFSGGEQGRLLFASILANRHMINQSHPYGGLDFLSVDEVFEGIDSVGLRDLVDAAKQLGICCMFITHVTDEEINEDILLIEKIDNVSRIVEN